MFEIDGKTYELHYNLKRIELIESILQRSLMGKLQESMGIMSIRDLCVAFAYGLREAGENYYVAPKKGMEHAQKLIESEGMAKLNMAVVDKIQEDCPFFFQVD